MPTEPRPTHLRLVPSEPTTVETQPAGDVLDLLSRACSDEVVENPQELRAALNDIYAELSLSDSELIGMLTDMEERGVVSRDDRMYLFVLFAAAQHAGHETLTFLRNEIVYERLQVQGLEQLIATIEIPDTLKRYLGNGLGRLAFQFAVKRKP